MTLDFDPSNDLADVADGTETVTLLRRGSTPGSRPISAWDWDFDYDGVDFVASGESGPQVDHVFDDDGVYTVAVRVTDAGDTTGFDYVIYPQAQETIHEQVSFRFADEDDT